MELLKVTAIHLNVKKQAKFPLGNQFYSLLNYKKNLEYNINLKHKNSRHASEQQLMKFYCENVGRVSGEIGSTPFDVLFEQLCR
ncbi:hypothetical protein T07_8381 [Trichinella nelsoni]|uniref:Uncharacterized protein n=1 Tax=Trichinella nelsoni TaxID=6336 RepID=A0A0V0SG54_9BILA|nr:hypothetical protein T07_8381 [Trichinella nelsoni]